LKRLRFRQNPRRQTVVPKKEPLQGEPIRGNDNPTITQTGYNGHIPPAAINALEKELLGLVHGTTSLTIHIRDGRFARFTTGRERSHMGSIDYGE